MVCSIYYFVTYRAVRCRHGRGSAVAYGAHMACNPGEREYFLDDTFLHIEIAQYRCANQLLGISRGQTYY